MDWSKIENLLQKGGGKFVICDKSGPKYVIMDIKEYEGLLNKVSTTDEETSGEVPPESPNLEPDIDYDEIDFGE